MPYSKAQILLVDDHPIMRHGMATFINIEPDLQVYAQAGSGEEALAILSKANDVIDIVLLDVTLKPTSGFEVIKNIQNLYPELPVLFVSMHDETVYAERSLRAGARGYVMKQEPGEVLVNAIRDVLQGKIYLSDALHEKLLNRIITGNTELESPINKLTPSEFEILHLIGSGHSSQEIAKLLQRSIKTIETHRFNIRTKLKLKNSAELIRYAARWVAQEQP